MRQRHPSTLSRRQGRDQSAAQIRDGVGGSLHGSIVATDDHQTVVIMCDGAGNRAALQANALDETQADIAGRVVAFDDGHLQQIARGIGDGLFVGDRGIKDEMAIGDEPDFRASR